MIYTTYEITNKRTNEFYIGVHKTANINDSYLGSGRHITNAVRKYGPNNFYKITTGVWKSEEIAYLIESWMVDNDTINDPMCYNGIEGGRTFGGSYSALSDKSMVSLKNKVSKSVSSSIWMNNGIRNRRVQKTNTKKIKELEDCGFSRGRYFRNPSERTVVIYDANDEIKFIFDGKFRENCKLNGLPFGIFSKALASKERISVITESKNQHGLYTLSDPLLFGNNKERARFEGWYVITESTN